MFKIGTLIFASIPAPEGNGLSMLENIKSFGFSCFFYFLYLLGTLYFWKNKLHPATTEVIDNLVRKVFMGGASTRSSDFLGGVAKSFGKIKEGYDSQAEESPFLMKIEKSINKVREPVAERIANNALLRRSTGLVTDKASFLRRGLRSATTLAT